MSRRTAVIAAALLLLIGARMPAWRLAAEAGAPTPDAAPAEDAARGWNAARTAWQLAPALSRRLGLVLEQEGS